MAFYFFLVVKYEKTNEELAKLEKYIHFGILTYAVGSSFLLLGLGQYNHVGTVCWVIGSPVDCENSSFTPSPDVACDRGNWAWIYGLFLFYIPLWISIALVITFNAIIYYHLLSSAMKDDAKWVSRQALLYALAFCVTWAPSTGWSVASWSGSGGFWLDLASAFFEPLAAFWNLLIFLRNRKSSKKKLMSILCCESYEDPDQKAIKETDTSPSPTSSNQQEKDEENHGTPDAEITRKEKMAEMLVTKEPEAPKPPAVEESEEEYVPDELATGWD